MKDIKLYSTAFISFIFITFAYIPYFLIFLTGKFFIDALILVVMSFVFFKKFDKEFFVDSIASVYGFGVLASYIGIWFTNSLESILFLVFNDFWNSFLSVFCNLLFPLIGIIIFAFLIYYFNYRFTYCNRVYWLTQKQRLAICLTLTIVTTLYACLFTQIIVVPW